MDFDSIQDSLRGLGDSFGSLLNRVFGSQNDRRLRKMRDAVKKINALEGWAQGLDADAVRAQTASWREEVANGRALEELLPEAFALAREAAVRSIGLRHFDVQMIGGMALHSGSIAEMATGEGKTLVATLAGYLNALAGKVYVVTVNDYLARRDSDWMRPVYEYLGLTVGAIQSWMAPDDRHPIYGGDVIYGTNNEFGFDYLRDNMKSRLEDQVQRQLDFAIVDEVDSILIDEARTPLIISGPATGDAEKFRVGMTAARKLIPEKHVELKEKERSAILTEEGIIEAQQLLGMEDFYSSPENMEWPHILEQCLRALHLYRVDDQYVVKDGQIIIVDEFTGRLMEGRRWSDGLHQSVEAKEGLRPRAENQTLATITFQNYFRLFKKLSGMTGTAITEAGEFARIYDLDVFAIPTNRPITRKDDKDVVYLKTEDKWKAISTEIETAQKLGQPVLVGTTSIENSELLSGMLSRRGVKHEVLNAKQHEREAEIIAQAGRKGSVTVATNMAGRGTDIVLGGNVPGLMKRELANRGIAEDDAENVATVRAELVARQIVEKEEVIAVGGLYVLGSERHEARRIDNQLRGRAGRQGDPGRSRFFLSLDDPLMRRFYRDWVKNFLSRAGMGDGEAVESRLVSNAIRKAQKKVEDWHFEIRKNLLEYDEVMNEQRRIIYGQRQAALEGRDLHSRIMAMYEESFSIADELWAGDGREVQPDFHALMLWAQRKWATESTEEDLEQMGWKPSLEHFQQEVERLYAAKAERLGTERMGSMERFLVLNAIDHKWKDHLYAMDALRSGIGLRGYAQVDPKNEYKREGLEAFQLLLEQIAEEVSNYVLRVELREEPAMPSSVWQGARAIHPEFRAPGSAPASGGAAPGGQRQRPQMAVGYHQQNSVSL
ncbi:MAG: preprotein translocase subunit SecA, partial [Planctomycetota bacterium]|nr:preprotein translocase subunit SecA [Planctomycetota bacterium]